jgi:hypothetical protein
VRSESSKRSSIRWTICSPEIFILNFRNFTKKLLTKLYIHDYYKVYS